MVFIGLIISLFQTKDYEYILDDEVEFVQNALQLPGTVSMTFVIMQTLINYRLCVDKVEVNCIGTL